MTADKPDEIAPKAPAEEHAAERVEIIQKRSMQIGGVTVTTTFGRIVPNPSGGPSSELAALALAQCAITLAQHPTVGEDEGGD